ncbi:MAG: hypothetical protein NZN28_01235, partial [Meiothermus sp.]|uniref:hypothetical protein n=1 Tax=Meiothermus sp. TaxID=1955249 RepID=UPI002600A4A9
KFLRCVWAKTHVFEFPGRHCSVQNQVFSNSSGAQSVKSALNKPLTAPMSKTLRYSELVLEPALVGVHPE